MKYIDRDLSWLSFNDRILQEVADQNVPLLEKIKFVAIYSSNLEEYYKVRVAGLRFEQKYRGDKKNKFGYRPSYILQHINNTVSSQQALLGKLFYTHILPQLEKENIFFIHKDLSEEDKALAKQYYIDHIKGNFKLWDISNEENIQLKNQWIYLYFISGEKKYLLELDYNKFGRFIILKQNSKETRIIQLDDIFRYNIDQFLEPEAQVYAIKISRDAELYIDEEQDDDIVRRIKKSLKKRETGLPCRLLFHEDIPFKYINYIRKKINEDMIGLLPGGKYHNFFDFFNFPVFDNKPHLYNQKKELVPCSSLHSNSDYFKVIHSKDIFFSYPYQSFEPISRFIELAAEDEFVTEINITIYRINTNSRIGYALEKAALNGKKVFVLAEVLARFDEESNIYWGERLEKAGATVKYGIKNLKVHAKAYTIERKEGDKKVSYAYLGTGNLNEKTASLYADHGILTKDIRYTNDLLNLFQYLKNEGEMPSPQQLLIAPFNLRHQIYEFIDREIANVKQGIKGEMYIKLNSLEDPDMIKKIREAADNGVKIFMVIRGVCCYLPLTRNQKKNITIVSVVDQFLEHTRIYHFFNGGKPCTYLASADWMTRNLYNRIEVAFPVFEDKLHSFLLDEMKVQLEDGKKGRIVDSEGSNTYVKGKNNQPSQMMMFDLVKKLNDHE